MLSDCPKTISDSSAKGRVSGSAEQDRDRVQPGLELGGQHQVHEDEREHEGEQEVERRLAHLLRACPAVPCGIRRIDVHGPDLAVERGQGLLLRVPGPDVGADRHLAPAVEPVDLGWALALLEARHVVEAHRAELRLDGTAIWLSPSRARAPPRDRRARGPRTARRPRRRWRSRARRPGAAACRATSATCTPSSAAFARSSCTDSSGLPSDERGVDVDRAGRAAERARHPVGVLGELARDPARSRSRRPPC